MSKVLVVEDDENICRAIKIRLEANGFEVLTSEDAILGMDSIVKKKPDVVLVDISIPGGNGLALAERFQKVLDSPPPFIVITASSLPGLRAKAAGLGAAGYFEKPFDVDDLIPAIRNLISTQ